MLDLVRRSLGISEGLHAALDREMQLEAYETALRSAWDSGIITQDDTTTQDNMRKMYGVRLEDHLLIEAAILRALRETGGRD